MYRLRNMLLTSLVLAIVILGAACGQGQEVETQSPTQEQAPATQSVEQKEPTETTLPPVRVGIYVDDAFGDRAFFDIALEAVPIIEEEFNATVNLYEGRLNTDNYGPLFDTAAANCDIVFILGHSLMDAMIEAAAKYPDTYFVNMSQSGVRDPNVVYNDFKDYEGTFLAGALAALTTSHTEMNNINPEKIVGFMGGMDVPVIQQGLGGFLQGVEYADPEAKVEVIMVGDFGDPVKGKEANLALIEKGADVILQYAGTTGEGGFNAAKEGAPMYAIGAGPDQRWLAPQGVIGSMLKRCDNAIVDYTRLYVEGKFPEKGAYISYGVVEKGIVMILSEDLLPAEVVSRVLEIQNMVATGEIVVIDVLTTQ